MQDDRAAVTAAVSTANEHSEKISGVLLASLKLFADHAASRAVSTTAAAANDASSDTSAVSTAVSEEVLAGLSLAARRWRFAIKRVIQQRRVAETVLVLKSLNISV